MTSIDDLSDSVIIDLAMALYLDPRVMELSQLREENEALRTELSNLKTLVVEWAHSQHVPANHKQGESLLPWLRRARELNHQLMRAGGVEPRSVPESEP